MVLPKGYPRVDPRLHLRFSETQDLSKVPFSLEVHLKVSFRRHPRYSVEMPS